MGSGTVLNILHRRAQGSPMTDPQRHCRYPDVKHRHSQAPAPEGISGTQAPPTTPRCLS